MLSDLRLKLQDTIHSMSNLICEEDEKHWKECYRDMRSGDFVSAAEVFHGDSEPGQGYAVEVMCDAIPSVCDSGHKQSVAHTVDVADSVTELGPSTAHEGSALESLGRLGGENLANNDIEIVG